jgi:hypothetical protein
VYAASHLLTPGQQLTVGDLRVVRVRLGGQSGRYLSASSGVPTQVVVIRSVQAGELLPRSALGPGDAVTSRPVAVPVSPGAVEGLKAGSLVDVWVARKGAEAETFDEPKALVNGAEVVSVSHSGGVLASSGEVTVRLLVADVVVPQILSAVDNGARVDLVAVPGSVPRGGS